MYNKSIISYPIHMSNSLETIRHSSAHLMAAAIQKLHPKAKFGVGPTVEDGFYYDIELDEQITTTDLKKIEKEMKNLQKQKLEYKKEEMKIDDAIDLFKKLLILEPNKNKIKKSLAEAYLWNKDYENAILLCREVISKNKNDIKAKFLLAQAFGYSGNKKEALKLYEELLQLKEKQGEK